MLFLGVSNGAFERAANIYIYISRRAIVNKITASISIPIQSFNNPTRDLNRAEADSTFEFEISPPPLWPLFSAIISDLSSESRCTQSYASKFECTGNFPSVLAESEHKGQTKLVIESLFTTTKILQLCSSMFRTGRLFDWKTGKRAIQEFNDPQISQSPDRRRERERKREGRSTSTSFRKLWCHRTLAERWSKRVPSFLLLFSSKKR